jgi:hypothetical protein
VRQWDSAFKAERAEREALEAQARQWDAAYRALESKVKGGG